MLTVLFFELKIMHNLFLGYSFQVARQLDSIRLKNII
jgi:hypothetical protein